jgi:hypothetical protein
MELKRVNSDVNGNPRYVCHFLEFVNDEDRKIAEDKVEKGFSYISELYSIALKKSRKIGGKKYHNKSYGGGIVFTSYNEGELEREISEIKLK